MGYSRHVIDITSGKPSRETRSGTVAAPGETRSGTVAAPGETRSGSRRRPLRRDAAMNRDRILSAASEVFAVSGLEASLAAVAERAGVGIGTIYRRFPDKEALVVALLEQKIPAVGRAAEQAAGLTSGWDAFTALIENLAKLLIADRALEEILLSQHADRALALLRPVTTDVINRACTDGALRPDIAFNDVAPLLVMVIGAADFSAGANPDSWRRYLQVMLDGLRDRPGTGPLATAPLTDSELDRASRAAPRRRR